MKKKTHVQIRITLSAHKRLVERAKKERRTSTAVLDMMFGV